VSTVQTQVIIGNDVVEVYRAIQAAFPTIGAGGAEVAASAPAQKASIGAIVIDFIIGVFQPLVPAIAGAGMLKAMLTLLSYL
ncbi:PTS beta-glucoside transporter subunit IIBCA, partial [Mycobacterium tuberculosis]|nr:PTS beta-glucoside transporter subunit IIBCA [Mycobacterium tuberculosis]